MRLKYLTVSVLLFFGLNSSANADELAIIYNCLNAQNKQFDLTLFQNSLYFKSNQSELYFYRDDISANVEYERLTEILFNNDDMDLVIPRNFYAFAKEGMIRLTNYQDDSYIQLYCKYFKTLEVAFPNP